jgi:hypothetical protein
VRFDAPELVPLRKHHGLTCAHNLAKDSKTVFEKAFNMAAEELLEHILFTLRALKFNPLSSFATLRK